MGHLKRPWKPEGPHYLAHQAVDDDYGIHRGTDRDRQKRQRFRPIS